MDPEGIEPPPTALEAVRLSHYPTDPRKKKEKTGLRTTSSNQQPMQL